MEEGFVTVEGKYCDIAPQDGGDSSIHIDGVNEWILELKSQGVNVVDVSDGNHTFGEYIDMIHVLSVTLYESGQCYDEYSDSDFVPDRREMMVNQEDSSTRIGEVNKYIVELKNHNISVKGISDGYYTFDEYIRRRNSLFVKLCKIHSKYSWKSMQHYNEENDPMFNGCFIAGIDTPGGMVTFHLKMEYWNQLDVLEVDRAPEYDGYTQKDVKMCLRSLNKKRGPK